MLKMALASKAKHYLNNQKKHEIAAKSKHDRLIPMALGWLDLKLLIWINSDGLGIALFEPIVQGQRIVNADCYQQNQLIGRYKSNLLA